MYKILAADQKEYGPVSADQIRQWIAEGRINNQARVMAEGGTDWRPLAAFPEFADALAAAAQSALPTASFAASPPPPPFGATQRPAPYGAPAPRGKTSGMAITSLILGILGICGVTALVGLILGIIAMSKIKKSNGFLGGFGIALAGTIVCALFLLLIPVIVVSKVVPWVAIAKQVAYTAVSENNMKQLALAAHTYAGAHNNQFPPAATWCDALQTSAPGTGVFFLDPSADATKRCSFGFNAKLGGRDSTNVNSNTVLFFETDGGWNVSGGPDSMLKQARHKTMTPGQTTASEVFVVAFADGHVEQVAVSGVAALRWNP